MSLWFFKSRQISQTKIADGYDALPKFGVSAGYYKNTIKNLGNIKGKVLDIGCGYGDLLLDLKKENPSIEMYGVDICKKAIDHCKKLGINASVANAQQLTEIKDNYFDWVLMSAMIEHVIDQKEALDEACRVLKTGGKLFLSTDNLIWQLIMYSKNILFPWKERYKRFKQPIDDEFTYRGLKKLLAKSNFKIVKRLRSGPFAIGEKYLRKYDWSICLHKRHWLICEKIS